MMRKLKILLLMVVMLLVFHGLAYGWNSQESPKNVSQTVNSPGDKAPADAPALPDSIEPWIPTIITVLITGIITTLGTWWISRGSQATEIKLLKKNLEQAEKEVRAAQAEERKELEASNEEKGILTLKLKSAVEEVTDLKRGALKLEDIRGKLRKSAVVRTYRQPVILVGPRRVGKTSLLMQWHAPWITSRLDRTQTSYKSEVPVYDFREEDKEPHFADPEILVPVHTHLVLRVHDFPGELDAQKSVCRTIIDETFNLQRESGKNLGVVLICMFDAEEAATGVSKTTREYYNGELFRELRSLVTHHQVDIERLILVFNKYDRLKAHFPNAGDNDLIRRCVDQFDPNYNLLHNVCNPEKVCEVFTMLSREEMHLKNRGAPIILGEAARAFVRAFAGKEAESKIIEQSASTYASEKFL